MQGANDFIELPKQSVIISWDKYPLVILTLLKWHISPFRLQYTMRVLLKEDREIINL